MMTIEMFLPRDKMTLQGEYTYMVHKMLLIKVKEMTQ